MIPRRSRAALVCIDPWTLEECEMRPFSYAIRKVQAAAVADPELGHWDLQVFDFRTKDIDEIYANVVALEPDLLGVSAYCWSFPIFIEVARRLKAERPQTTIVFGGPSARLEMFNLAPFREQCDSVDALVIGEGEDVFREILNLEDRSRASLSRVPGLAVSTGTNWSLTPPRPLPILDTLASPYVLKLVGSDPDDHRATGHLETFRGCPFSCTFCQWGDLSGKSNRAFSTEYLIRELTAFQELNFQHTLMMDAALNLNQRAFRNLVAAEREVGFFRNSHLITEVYPAHITDEHIKFLSDTRDVSLAIGLQSLTKEVLDGVERPFNEARFRRVVSDLVSVAAHTTIELIVGLPGDTPATFRDTLERIFELGCGVRIYRCLVLPNALMTRAPASFQMEYDPITLRMHACKGWSRNELDGMLRELGDRVAAAPSGRAFVLDEGNTFAFSPPSVPAHAERHYRHDIHEHPIEPSLPQPLAAQQPLRVEPQRPLLPSHRPLGTITVPDEPPPTPVAPSIQQLMESAVSEATGGGWRLLSAMSVEETLLLRVNTSDQQLREIEVRAARPGAKAFRVIEGMAFSYLDNGTPLSKLDQRHLDATVRGLRKAVALAVRGVSPSPGE